mmetsp:Transcript_22863/g.48634  ORF Transcript_22863/g.48634 Transcript_22863/m.48634 type:complete len:82 (+) Transcript_22863:663-908(+)
MFLNSAGWARAAMPGRNAAVAIPSSAARRLVDTADVIGLFGCCHASAVNEQRSSSSSFCTCSILGLEIESEYQDCQTDGSL